jgi:hypothetical protein
MIFVNHHFVHEALGGSVHGIDFRAHGGCGLLSGTSSLLSVRSRRLGVLGPDTNLIGLRIDLRDGRLVLASRLLSGFERLRKRFDALAH